MKKWIKDRATPGSRNWEDFYRNRWQYDKVVRSTHGVNCTGGCSWNVYVKNGLVGWEMQANDYPKLAGDNPNYEPRGCPRGNSYSWYLYSPLRVKYPYVRGELMDLWREARSDHEDPVAAWAHIVEDPALRRQYVEARGKGGFRRAEWEEITELIAASTMYTAMKYGPDRVIGFTPIPAMSMLSYASGTRFLQLMGGVVMSFYDWYCDLPPASPQVWGEQTDVNESADWYNAGYIAVVGSNVAMTRTPDAHFLTEARYNGTKVAVFTPDYAQTSKFGDLWVPVERGHDGAFWMAVNHVILKEYFFDKETAFFTDYVKRYSDLPFLVRLEQKADGTLRPGQFLRASVLSGAGELENAEWLLCVMDTEGKVRIPKGSVGTRWSEKKGDWNLDMKDVRDDTEIHVELSVKGEEGRVVTFTFEDAGEISRELPVRTIRTPDGDVPVTSVFDLLAAQMGISRGFGGQYPESYEDDTVYTPKWQEKFTGVSAKTVIDFAREWAENAVCTQGRNLIIIGAGANHWYHNDLLYRACIMSLILTGSVGRNGAGLAHYVGQEKVVPLGSWTSIAMAHDWVKPSRLQNTPSFWYVHSDQWRYDRAFDDYLSPDKENTMPHHSADVNAKAVRMGWLPFSPHFNDSPIRIVEEAVENGATSDEDIANRIVNRLKSGELKFAIEDPDAPENFPRVWFIWRANAIGSSGKGHEYFLKHVLGTTHNGVTAEESGRDAVHEINWKEKAPNGKMDLVVDINFRMDTSAMYSDIVLPAASWYEKKDMNTTDMHSFVNCMDQAVPPIWESKPDWDIFQKIAKSFSRLAEIHMPKPFKDVIALPLLHDTPGEIQQPKIRDWKLGEIEAIPGKTMPNFKVVERDYANLYNRYRSLGPGAGKMGAHGHSWDTSDFVEQLKREKPTITWNNETFISLEEEETVIDVILALAPETNGELACRAYRNLEERTGQKLAHLAESNRELRMAFSDLKAQPQRFGNSPVWSGLVGEGRAYAPYTFNVEYDIPWRTLSGRQSLYLDHPYYAAFGEGLPVFKGRIDPKFLDEVDGFTGMKANLLTPHGKWSIHSTYYDNLRMLTLSRGGQTIWINNKDAAGCGIQDNDWVEMLNRNGVVVARAIVSSRIASGTVLMYHAPERTLFIPKSDETGKRGGIHNSLCRTRLKPTLMLGGYAQFSYHFNYWGPTGVNRDTYVVIRKHEGR